MKSLRKLWKALLVIALFTTLYLVLTLVKHHHYLSGYDIAVYDQVIWKYSVFHNPLTTIHAYPFTNILTDHIELTVPFLAPLFWLWNSIDMLIIFQVVFFCLSGLPMYLLARRKGLNEALSLTLLFSYLFFFGTQNALWDDFHSNVLGVGFLSWMIYFLETGQNIWMWGMFALSLLSKEDMPFLTMGVGTVWLVKNILEQKTKHAWHSLITSATIWKNKKALLLIFFSVAYLLLIFTVYFPHFTPQGYRFSQGEGLFTSATHFSYFFDTVAKKQIILYSLVSFGFLPLLAPLFVFPAFLDLYHFFVIGHLVESASEIFLHYRISLAPLLVWPTIYASLVITNKVKNSHSGLSRIFSRSWMRFAYQDDTVQFGIALYLLFCAFVVQYALHLPMSYLTKSWFWHQSPAVTTIEHTLTYLPKNASVVSQNNITPHIAHRDNIFTLWGTTVGFKTAAESPCGQTLCPYFHWVGNPQYMIVDTSPDWDIRHLLQNRPDYLSALNTFEKLGKIKAIHQEGTTTLYKVLQNP